MTDFLRELAQTSFGTAVAFAAIWLAYFVIKRRTNGSKKSNPGPSTPEPTNPFSTMPDTGVHSIPPGSVPVTKDECSAFRDGVSRDLKTIGRDIGHIRKENDNLNTKITNLSSRYDSSVSQLDKAVAVLEDRAKR